MSDWPNANKPVPDILRECTREQLERIAVVALETMNQIDDWMGSASTRSAAVDSMWRLRKTLDAAGLYWYTKHNNNLEWRGSLIAALDRAGWRCGDDECKEIRRVTPDTQPWEWAKGVTLAEFTETLDLAKSEGDPWMD